jgi:hypothetical protein
MSQWFKIKHKFRQKYVVKNWNNKKISSHPSTKMKRQRKLYRRLFNDSFLKDFDTLVSSLKYKWLGLETPITLVKYKWLTWVGYSWYNLSDNVSKPRF